MMCLSPTMTCRVCGSSGMFIYKTCMLLSSFVLYIPPVRVIIRTCVCIYYSRQQRVVNSQDVVLRMDAYTNFIKAGVVMVNQVFIRANVICRRTSKNYEYSMPFTVYEDDGVPLYPPQTSGCTRCQLSAPCPACVAYVINEVFRALPLPNRSSIDVEPPATIREGASL